MSALSRPVVVKPSDEEIGSSHQQKKKQTRGEDGPVGHALAVCCHNQDNVRGECSDGIKEGARDLGGVSGRA